MILWLVATLFIAVTALVLLVISVRTWRRTSALSTLQARGINVKPYWVSAFWVISEEHIILHGRGTTITDVVVPAIAQEIKSVGNVECVYVGESALSRDGARRLWLALDKKCGVEVEIDGIWYAFEPADANEE
jgi:hypothetical protein